MNAFRKKIPESKRENHLLANDIETPGRLAWHRLRQNKAAMVGLYGFACIALICLVGPLFINHDSNTQNLLLGPTPPSLHHWFGTDTLGRDLLIRTLEGGRISIAVGFAATLVALGIGVTWGSIAGYSGGWIDSTMMRLVDILYSLPFVIFVILLMAIFERSLLLLFAAIGFVEWLTLARIVRNQVIQLKTQPYIDAAKCLGIGKLSIIYKHLLPNFIGPVIVYTTLTIPSVILLESSLSFLGLGVQPPNSSWGSLINDGAEKMVSYPWLLAFPCIFFSVTLLALNFLGDGLRDALDPKSKRS